MVPNVCLVLDLVLFASGDKRCVLTHVSIFQEFHKVRHKVPAPYCQVQSPFKKLAEKCTSVFHIQSDMLEYVYGLCPCKDVKLMKKVMI